MARGVPPQWCSTAAAAETWALLEVLRLSVTIPRMRTDCQSLIKVARQGLESAVRADRPLARIWREIGRILDGDITVLERHSLLVWQPAHQSVQTIGQRRGSDGRKITAVGWRANRLADALAKQGAEMIRVDAETRELVDSAQAASLHAACLLGQVTFLANNHKAQELDEEGNSVTVTLRDSDSKPRNLKRKLGSGGEPANKLPLVAKPAVMKRGPSLLELERAPRVKRPCTMASRAAAHAIVEAEKATLKRIIEERGSQLKESTAEPAAKRMDMLMKRVRMRLGRVPA
eukprot:4231383-Karenia_brevis.AAC.1